MQDMQVVMIPSAEPPYSTHSSQGDRENRDQSAGRDYSARSSPVGRDTRPQIQAGASFERQLELEKELENVKKQLAAQQASTLERISGDLSNRIFKQITELAKDKSLAHPSGNTGYQLNVFGVALNILPCGFADSHGVSQQPRTTPRMASHLGQGLGPGQGGMCTPRLVYIYGALNVCMFDVGSSSSATLEDYPVDSLGAHPLKEFMEPIWEAFETLSKAECTPGSDRAVRNLCTYLSLMPEPKTYADRVRAVHTEFLNTVQLPSANPEILRQAGIRKEFMRKAGPFIRALHSMVDTMK